MNKEDRKQRKRNYQQSAVPMGVFLIRNIVNDKVFVVAGRNLQGIINRHRFDLIAGSHRNKSLQSDWALLGSQNFAFEILEEFTPPDDSQIDEAKELSFMEKLWLEKLRPFAERGYNEPILSRAEKLRRIAANRLAKPDR
ncbi:MAG: GIY-YIG nuclease family protein [Pyrinomonadaceae bacterium]|nr:GIY-YIG nuclease family protein [Pyrinomonadaceae bacterium]